jgi:hypothetical protein
MQSTARILLVSFFCGIFLWDLAMMLLVKDPSSTISWALYSISCEHPIIAFAFGLLCGHVFWPLKS